MVVLSSCCVCCRVANLAGCIIYLRSIDAAGLLVQLPVEPNYCAGTEQAACLEDVALESWDGQMCRADNCLDSALCQQCHHPQPVTAFAAACTATAATFGAWCCARSPTCQSSAVFAFFAKCFCSPADCRQRLPHLLVPSHAALQPPDCAHRAVLKPSQHFRTRGARVPTCRLQESAAPTCAAARRATAVGFGIDTSCSTIGSCQKHPRTPCSPADHRRQPRPLALRLAPPQLPDCCLNLLRLPPLSPLPRRWAATSFRRTRTALPRCLQLRPRVLASTPHASAAGQSR